MITLTSAVLIGATSLFFGLFDAAADGAHPGSQPYAPGRLIIRLTEEANLALSLSKSGGAVATGLAQLDNLNSQFGVTKQVALFRPADPAAKSGNVLSAIYILETSDTTDVLAMARAYGQLPEIKYAEPDYRIELFDSPNDPLFSNQWSLNNTGQEYLGVNRIAGDTNDSQILKRGIPGADIDALAVFDTPRLTTIPLIGIIDTGIDTDHEDLQGNIWVNPGEDLNGNGVIDPEERNGLDDDHDGYIDDFYGWDFSGVTPANPSDIQGNNDPSDYFGHGTHCAGIAAAVRDNGIGISGIAGHCRIMAIKIFPNAYYSICAQGIVYATDMGCNVISMSWGGPSYSNLLQDAISYARSQNVVPVAAAGNSGNDNPLYPAALPNVIGVGASNSLDQVTSFSTYGPAVRVIAPGQDILSLRAAGTDMYAEMGEPNVHIVNDKYYIADGTSMAAPCAAGVAAALVAASPGISVDSLEKIIEASADDIIYPYGDSTKAYPGRDYYSGYGRVNLNAAMQLLTGKLAKIDFPYKSAVVAGDVAIIGTAAGTTFSGYNLEYGEGKVPVTWISIRSSAIPIANDTLAVWHTAGLNGMYSLRLTVGSDNVYTVSTFVINTPQVKITSPHSGDTVAGFVSIFGSVLVTDFAHYILLHGVGAAPSQWDTVAISLKFCFDDLLGKVLLDVIDDGPQTIRLIATTRGGASYTDQITIIKKSIVNTEWVRTLPAVASVSPASGDINGDGQLEIIAGAGAPYTTAAGGAYAFSSQGSPINGWPKNVGLPMASTPAVGDLDGDGVDDIIICSSQGVHAFLSHNSSWMAPASTVVNDRSFATPVIADIDNDGVPEILFINGDGRAYAFHNDGRPVIPGDGTFVTAPRIGAFSTDFGRPGITAADLDGDGQKEIIICSAEGVDPGAGGLYLYDCAGHPLFDNANPPDSFSHISGFAVANIDNNPDQEVIVFGGNGNHFIVDAIRKNGTHAAGYPFHLPDLRTGDWFGTAPAVGDLDGDGTKEIVVTTWDMGEGRVYAWHQDGSPLGKILPPNDSIGATVPILARADGMVSSPLLVDVNGDGRLEIVVRFKPINGEGFDRVMAWNSEGDAVPGFPHYTSPRIDFGLMEYDPIAGDFDLDDSLELALGLDGSGTSSNISLLALHAPYKSSATSWLSSMHDSWNSHIAGFVPPGRGLNVPPFDLHVKSNTPQRVTLGWTPKNHRYSSGYNIYRSSAAGQPGIKVSTNPVPQADSVFVDSQVVAGASYYYTITNLDTLLAESRRSSELTVIVGQPSPPTGLAITVNPTNVALHWHANPSVEQITKYRVYFKGAHNTAFYLRDSVLADTAYIDPTAKPQGTNAYCITAVNSFGEGEPSTPVDYYVDQYAVAPSLSITDWVDTNVTLGWYAHISSTGQGCNLYRSTVSGVYNGPPLNKSYLGDSLSIMNMYIDSGLTRGVMYYYVVTQIRNNVESPLSVEVSFLAGRPHAIPELNVASFRDSIVLHNSCSDPDIAGYRIYRRELSGTAIVIDSLVADTLYTDHTAAPDVDYYYHITAMTRQNVESFASVEKEGCLMIFDRNLAVFDRSQFGEPFQDSLRVFYERSLHDYNYTYQKHNPLTLTLFDLHQFKTAIISSPNEIIGPNYELFTLYPTLKIYIDAGGSLIVEGRNVLSSRGNTAVTQSYQPGSFEHDYLGLDSAYLTKRGESIFPHIGFDGGHRSSYAVGYPDIVTVDTSRIHAFSPLEKAPLGAVDYFFSRDSSDVLFTYVASSDTSIKKGKAVALRRTINGAKLYWFTFPFYYLGQNDAAALLRAIMTELAIPTDVSSGSDNSVMPTRFALDQNYPNPFNPTTVIRYALPSRSHVTIEVFNVLGQRVRTLLEGDKPAGYYTATWDGSDSRGKGVASGIYFYRIKAGDFIATKKMVLLK